MSDELQMPPTAKIYERVYAASPVDQKRPRGWIQWKGTEVCVDIHCSCGRLGHVDGMFAYSVRCPCGKLWGMDPNITLVELEASDVVGACEPKTVDCEDDPADDVDDHA